MTKTTSAARTPMEIPAPSSFISVTSWDWKRWSFVQSMDSWRSGHVLALTAGVLPGRRPALLHGYGGSGSAGSAHRRSKETRDEQRPGFHFRGPAPERAGRPRDRLRARSGSSDREG